MAAPAQFSAVPSIHTLTSFVILGVGGWAPADVCSNCRITMAAPKAKMAVSHRPVLIGLSLRLKWLTACLQIADRVGHAKASP